MQNISQWYTVVHRQIKRKYLFLLYYRYRLISGIYVINIVYNIEHVSTQVKFRYIGTMSRS